MFYHFEKKKKKIEKKMKIKKTIGILQSRIKKRYQKAYEYIKRLYILINKF